MPEARIIKSMFNNISGSYDILNDLLSLGVHRFWKKKLVVQMLKGSPKKILDCATGTGDIAINMKNTNPEIQITGIDFSPGMLKIAQSKTTAIIWEVQDLMALNFSDKQFDASSISYGIRNVEDYKIALSEMARVSTEKICILEFGQPQNFIFRAIYFGIMKYFMPVLGRLFNKQEAYQYLIDSSMNFPCADDFCGVIKEATGFDDVTYIPFFGGVTYLYTAKKLN